MKNIDDVLIIGAGGHGREILEILLEEPAKSNPIGFIDDDTGKRGEVVDGYEVICGTEQIVTHWKTSEILLICAIGEPAAHSEVVTRLLRKGFRFANVISKHAVVSDNAIIGNGVIIFPSVTINTRVEIGNHVTVNVGSTISHDSKIGDYTNIAPGSHIAGNVVIGQGCYVGMGSNLIQNVTIGEWVKIGAGAAVIRDINSYSTAYGVPAKAAIQKSFQS